MNSDAQPVSPAPLVLLVDDEPGVRHMVALLLAREGYEVIEVSTPGEAFEVARARRPALVITDVVMPEMDGYELVRELRADPALGQTPVVMFSGALTDERSRLLADKFSVQGFWDKTSPPSSLLGLVREAIQPRKAIPGWTAPGGQLEKEHARLLADTLHRKLAELEASEERFKLLLESIADYAICFLDRDGRVASWNTGAERIQGYKSDEIMGQHISRFRRAEDRGQGEVEAGLKRAAEEGRHEDAGWRVRRDGTLFWADAVITAVRDRQGGLRGFALVIRDMTQQRQAQEELKELLARLRALSRRMERIREEERTHIAREIHDEFGQALTALKMDLTHLESSLPKSRREWIRQCRSMHGIIDHTIKVAQNVASELRLGHLDELGLGAAVEWQVQEFQKRTGIHCEIGRLDELGDELGEGRATTAYRILQEALTNVARHAKATAVKVSLFRDGNGLVLEVRDNGHGITAQQLADKRSIGLLGMQERARALGGEVDIFGANQGGTTVLLKLPLSRRD